VLFARHQQDVATRLHDHWSRRSTAALLFWLDQ
jgi:hypothetical protein